MDRQSRSWWTYTPGTIILHRALPEKELIIGWICKLNYNKSLFYSTSINTTACVLQLCTHTFTLQWVGVHSNVNSYSQLFCGSTIYSAPTPWRMLGSFECYVLRYIERTVHCSEASRFSRNPPLSLSCPRCFNSVELPTGCQFRILTKY